MFKFLLQNFGTLLSLKQFIVIRNPALYFATVWSIVKPIQAKERASFCAQNFLQCVLNFTEQEPKPQKLRSLKTPFA